MSVTWAAVWIGIGAPAALYATKRLIDYVFPPGSHLPWLDRYTRPNRKPIESEEDTDGSET
jgi:hypothetical protein